ncbi:MAG: PBSX family phage terminase large subunit [Clostridium sp.]|uniref:PBSX family phage terminase large subunit n=1 Tax=Clostridium sp. TaxID=1506 RepID=UPI00290D3872|nr:PBSX family phage terminase large subunit [Clostridium sp.]MDU7339030.1 PBSX family phage terminase large subunit [Clostridium sp.]
MGFSEKQKEILKFPYTGKTALICDGAVRSGKTAVMSLSYILWAMANFNGQNFGICGKTVISAERNVVKPLLAIKYIRQHFNVKFANHVLTVSRGNKTNTFYVFGGKDEASYMLIQGITLAGVFLDEVALMPESFVNQALARCSVTGSKYWFNCNPESPTHWFYKEWILDPNKKHNAVHLHFQLDDNPSLSEEKKKEYYSNYTGVFFDRYILGLWKTADGAIYQKFADNPDNWIIPDYVEPRRSHELTGEELKARDFCQRIDFISIGVDFGGNRSLTTFVATAIMRGFSGITVIRDHNIKGRKGEIDADRVAREFVSFVRKLQADYPHAYIKYCFADCAEQYLINTLRKACITANLGIKLGDSDKNPIVQRIICANTLLGQNKLHLMVSCTLVRGGLEAAVWDSKAADKGEDVRLDDFSTDIDILDAFEYSFERFMKKLLPEGVK